jgi:tetratricopeptide (TPR) repeat protein
MKRLVLLFAFLFCFLGVQTRAQSSGSSQMQKVSSSQSSDSETTLTPNQLAELRADILMARKMYPQAISAYEKLAKEEPKDSVLLNKIGVAYEIMGNNGRAEHYFKKAMKADKAYASPVNNVGTVEYAKKHYSNAIKYYEKTLTLKMEAPATVYANLGYAYVADKKYLEAMDTFEHAIRLDPHIFQEHGDFGSYVRQPTTTDPGLFYFIVARTYAQMGNAERAAHYLTMSRDDGYTNYTSAKTDSSFAKVIKDPRMQKVFLPVPVMAEKPR